MQSGIIEVNLRPLLFNSFSHGFVASVSFFAVAAAAHLLNISSMIGGGAAVLAVAVLSLIAGLLPSARPSSFVLGFVFATIAWWTVGAVVNGAAAAIMYGVAFATLAVGYGVAAFLAGMGGRLLFVYFRQKTGNRGGD